MKRRLPILLALVIVALGVAQFRGTSPAQAREASAAPIPASQISAGNSYTCALFPTGMVACWGANAYGQLGNGKKTASPTPAVVLAGASGSDFLSSVKAISADGNHTCALRSGSVWCWGANNYGQLGNGKKTASSLPVRVRGVANSGFLTKVIAISAGGDHTCALLSNHTLRCWGSGATGQLGNGKTSSSSTPVAVKGVANATAVSAGGFHTCALLAIGTVKCWGLNKYGELGNPKAKTGTVPVQVSGISTVTQLSAGSNSTCARLASGMVYCWGQNSSGQLGDGTTVIRRTPVQVSAISTATTISAGLSHACARLANGTLECWGAGSYGQLGDGKGTSSSTPVTVSNISSTAQASAGGYHTCSLLADGGITCWGRNDSGQLGNGKRGGIIAYPYFHYVLPVPLPYGCLLDIICFAA